MLNDVAYQAFEVTTNIEGEIQQMVVDVNAEDTVIDALNTFNQLHPNKSQFITDIQLISGAGRDDFTLLLLGNRPENAVKAFKIAFNLLSRNQRYAFNRTPDVINMINTEKNSA
jgi:hypothetical protein